MAKIYLIRHAESLANTQGRYQGQTYDTPLSILGKQQAKVLGQKLQGIHFDAIFSSPLKRTIETAQVLGKPIFTSEILETNHGDWEGKTFAETKYIWPEMYKLWQAKPSQVVFPNGEAFTKTAQRAVSWLQKLQKQEGTFAVVTHSNIIFTLLCHYLNKPLDTMWQFNIQPTCISLIDNAKVSYYNDASHLNGLASDLTIQAI